MENPLRSVKTVLFPVDFSESSAGAAGYVREIAVRFQSKVIALHVLEPIEHPFEEFAEGMFEQRPRRTIAEQRLRKFCADHIPDLDPAICVHEGDPAQEIAGLADSSNCDLIVMPTRGRGPFRRLLLGSVTAKVLHDVPCPVLTGAHLQDQADGRGFRIGHVLCAYSLDANGTRALEAASQFASAYRAELEVLHVLDQPTDDDGLREDVARYQAHRVVGENHIRIETGEPHKVVCRVADDLNSDLVVIGRGCPGATGRLPTTSYAIIRESPCAVLSV